ncbi:MAG: hypothetical protein PHE73_09130 [Sulfurovaceae bacterium]|nr:hypothetical protein [Sulfurovaceae bacterium]
MNKLTKQYQVWILDGCSGYNLTEYDTLQEALEAVKYTNDYYITKKVEYTVIEKSNMLV